MKASFSLVGEKAAQIYLNAEDPAYKGIRIAAEAFAGDVYAVTGKRPEIVTELSKVHGPVIAVGTMLTNPLVKEVTEKEKWTPESIRGRWECYSMHLAEGTVGDATECLVISGSDKRGCIYGIYKLSELIGVSPWVWFADVTPEKKETLVLSKEQVELVSKEPSVKYRGIFINDESPSFTGWAYGKFGALNDKMYCHVFELILRLKGNYLWPAMWGNIFSEEGSAHPQDNIRLADEYGVVMGTSHHEPMCRAGEEWRYLWKKYTDKYNWDFAVNREGISKFWEDGIKRNKPYESVITVGMRGEADSALAGGLQYNIDLLKDIILTQKEMLQKAGLSKAPKMFVVYKEVEKYWNGGKDELTGKEAEGLKNWKLPDGSSPLDDVVIMLCEDNFGNVRSLPVTKQLRERNGGWGMYYHFDYNGAPRGYMWLNVMQLEKTWEQLSEAYDFGVRDIWIVNVGDLKPMEMQISYYMDLAYDFETYGTEGHVTPKDYYLQFVKQQFSYGVSEEIQLRIAEILARYCKINAICKPEYMREHIFSIENFKEAPRMLKHAVDLIHKTVAVREEIPAELFDAFDELVYYPAVASANVVVLYVCSAYNRYYAELKDSRANGFADLVEECIEGDAKLMRHYNETVAGGKWKKMMSQPHLGYVAWNAENCAPPVPVRIKGAKCMFSGEALLADIVKDVTEGSNVVTVPVGVEAGNGLHIGSGGIITMEAEHFSGSGDCTLKNGKKASFRVIPEYGRSRSAIKVFPVTMEVAAKFDKAESLSGLPYAEYQFYADMEGEYTVRTYLAPSNNLDGDKSELRYGVCLDGEQCTVVNALPEGYVSGDWNDAHWSRAVIINAHICEHKVSLTKGKHILRFYGIDAGLVLQKLVLYTGKLPESYLGPEESVFIK